MVEHNSPFFLAAFILRQVPNHVIDGVVPSVVVIAPKIERFPCRYLPRLHVVNLIRKAQDEPADAVYPGNQYLVGMQRAAHIEIAAIAIMKVGLLGF